MSFQARQEFYLGRSERPEDRLARVEAVSGEQVEEVADEILSGNSLSLSIVGDVKNLTYKSAELAAAVA
jgi:predicted Zn-dependent peptidase